MLPNVIYFWFYLLICNLSSNILTTNEQVFKSLEMRDADGPDLLANWPVSFKINLVKRNYCFKRSLWISR